MVADTDDGKKMPLLDHLIELRSRLLISVVALFVVFIVSFFFAEALFRFLAQPLADVLLDTPGTERAAG